MKKISSKMTYFHKRIFPVLWFLFVGIFAFVTSYLSTSEGQPFQFLLLPIPFIMAIFGYFVFKNFLFPLVDEVHDVGDFLLIKNNGKEEKVPLSNIRNINFSYFVNPQIAIISLAEPIALGAEIHFAPEYRLHLNPFKKNPLIENLIDRAYQARAAK